jgi:hypothetical protein
MQKSILTTTSGRRHYQDRLALLFDSRSVNMSDSRIQFPRRARWVIVPQL